MWSFWSFYFVLDSLARREDSEKSADHSANHGGKSSPKPESPTARMLPGPPARPARRPAGGQPEVFRANSADRMWTGRGAECRTGSNRSSEACAWPRPRWGRACSGLKRHVMTLHDVVSRPQFVIKFSQVYTERYGEFDTALTHELYCSCRSIIYSGLTIW